jgi:hypothetical protein
MTLNLIDVDICENIVSRLGSDRSLVNLWLNGNKIFSAKLHLAMLRSKHIAYSIKPNLRAKSDLDIYIKKIINKNSYDINVAEALDIMQKVPDIKILSIKCCGTVPFEHLSALKYLTSLSVPNAAFLKCSFLKKLPSIVSLKAYSISIDIENHIFTQIKKLSLHHHKGDIVKIFNSVENLTLLAPSAKYYASIVQLKNLRSLKLHNDVEIVNDLLKKLSITHSDKLTHITCPVSTKSTKYLARFKNLCCLHILSGTIDSTDLKEIFVRKLILGDVSVNLPQKFIPTGGNFDYLTICSEKLVLTACFLQPKVLICFNISDLNNSNKGLLTCAAETIIIRLHTRATVQKFLESFALCHPKIKNIWKRTNPPKCCQYLEIKYIHSGHMGWLNPFKLDYESYVQKSYLKSVYFTSLTSNSYYY